MEKALYVPKGTMCINCINRNRDDFCGDLDFKAMKILGKYDANIFKVKCDEYTHESKYES